MELTDWPRSGGNQDLTWRKSSRSGGNGGNCVEVAESPAGVFVRDSKAPSGGTLQFEAGAWREFITAVKVGAIV